MKDPIAAIRKQMQTLERFEAAARDTQKAMAEFSRAARIIIHQYEVTTGRPFDGRRFVTIRRGPQKRARSPRQRG